MSKIKYGRFGNIADNGCGVIAVYNALVPFRANKSFKSVNEALSKKALLGGLAGCSLNGMTKYLTDLKKKGKLTVF